MGLWTKKMYSLTIFKSIFDNKTHRRMDFDTFDELEELLYELSKKPGYKPKKDDRRIGSPLITPATYEMETTRANRNVVEWAGWVALDIDEYDGTFDEAIEKFKTNRFVCYSSASSSQEKPKFRVVLPLTKRVPAEKIKHLWYAINHEFGSIGDAQTKDLSRMYYVPADYPGSYKFIFSHKDAPMIDPEVLMAKHNFFEAYKESKWGNDVEKMLEQFKKDNLCNYDIKWSSYRDCPFVNKQLVTEYQVINETGWYHKMYQIMVSVAAKALKRSYPITPKEISALCKEIDSETGGWYKNRPLELEASRAIEYAMKNV